MTRFCDLEWITLEDSLSRGFDEDNTMQLLTACMYSFNPFLLMLWLACVHLHVT